MRRLDSGCAEFRFVTVLKGPNRHRIQAVRNSETPIANKKTMKTIQVGEVVPMDSVTTINGTELKLKNSEGLVYLRLARFSGCPVCNFQIKQFAGKMDTLKAKGILAAFVLHSEAEVIQENQGTAPWSKDLNWVADPKRSIYQAVGAEKSAWALFSFSGLSLALKYAKDFAFPRKGDESGPNQRPMDLLINSADGKVMAMHYGKRFADTWSIDQVLKASS
jgi:hypothetical protein